MSVVSGDALIEAVAVVGGILLRRGLTIELSGATRDFTTVPDGRSMAPIETFTHSELRRKCVVNAELDGASIQEPGLIAAGVARHIKGVPRPIRVNHEA